MPTTPTHNLYLFSCDESITKGGTAVKVGFAFCSNSKYEFGAFILGALMRYWIFPDWDSLLRLWYQPLRDTIGELGIYRFQNALNAVIWIGMGAEEFRRGLTVAGSG